MVTLLAKIWIRNSEDVTSQSVRQAYGVLCGIVGIVLNLFLSAGKLFAGIVSGSVAIMADAANNLSDAASSLIVLIGFKLSGQKADESHPYGHGRAEYVSGLIVSVLIILMAFELLQSSVRKMVHPEATEFSYVVVGILIASILVKFYMFCYNRTIGKKIESETMMATAIDSISDTGATFVVLVSNLVGHFFDWKVDGWCGALVALFIFYAGYCAAKDTISPLLGQAPEEGFVRQIGEIVLSQPEILGMHDLVVHNYGPGRVMISLHAEVPAKGNILELHDKIDLIEHRLRSELKCEAVIHMDPILAEDEETNRLKELVRGLVGEMDSEFSIHDFRIMKGPTHTNLIFDLLVPFGYPQSNEVLINELQSRIKKIDETYYPVIEVDRGTKEIRGQRKR